MHQIVLRAHQLLLGVFALQHLFTQSLVEAFQVAGTLDHTHFQLTPGLAFEGNALKVMATALHHQADQ